MATLTLDRLTKVFGEHVVAVNEVSLDIAHGELVALLGPSGCGKTTTLRLIAGFMEPDDGQISIGGHVIASPARMVPPERRNMSMIFQSYAIWPHKTIYENVAYGLKFRGAKGAAADTRIRRILDVVKLGALADRYPGELSGGQQQRVALARALVVEPEILLLDEPLSNLDANLREEMRFEIRRLHDEFQITSVYVTHDQSEAMVIADRICVMNHGRLEQVGTPREIYDRPRTRFIAEFVGKTNLLVGTPDAEGRVVLGDGVGLHLPEPPRPDAAGRVHVSLRPHAIRLAANGERFEGYDAYPGRVEQGFYFGDVMDYLVELSPEVTLRVVSPAEQRLDAGQQVNVLIRPEDCIVVEG